ncbi:hypothetical protein B0H17DRAFT_1123972 [Mycena rosella]|uniref:Uncharacterized protein n=1 Tax=Mycena rosella TaxID=1033263 RepID=A0AAD7H406_MYCRO|nr:hypothetical protein B0H17DRAFT_1123972 [Mycena rosella]
MASTLTAVPTPKVFLDNVKPPPPVVLLLANTDIHPPILPPLLMDIDIRHKFGTPTGHRSSTTHPSPKTSTPHRSIPPATAKAKSPSPSRRASSPLSSDDEQHIYPPGSDTANRVLIPRPTGAQLGAPESHLNITPALLKDIKSVIALLAKEKLNLQLPVNKQAADARRTFTMMMHKNFPVLQNYEKAWALTILLTAHLKNTKAQLSKVKKNTRLAVITAAVGGGN